MKIQALGERALCIHVEGLPFTQYRIYHVSPDDDGFEDVVKIGGDDLDGRKWFAFPYDDTDPTLWRVEANREFYADFLVMP